jgi:integrase/recombinase XerD
LNDFYKSASISGKSDSTIKNYARQLATISIHHNRLPTELSSDQINEYLYIIKQKHFSPSESYFKQLVYSMRYIFRMYGMDDKRIQLPRIKKQKKLPVVLSREEVKRLLIAPKLLKHRILLGLLYGCGLRCFEARNIRLADLDFDRKMLHIRQGKGKKDRYVPLSEILIRGLKKYIKTERPERWLFNGNPLAIGRARGDFDGRYSQRGVQWAVNQARKESGILKEMTVHTLRHTFATHLLEDGLDIITIKDLLGHSRIDSTLVYLQVVHLERKKPFSPLDTLYI